MAQRFPIRIHISTALVLLTLLVGGAIAFTAYQKTAAILKSSSAELAVRATHEAANELDRLLAPARMAVGLLSARHPWAAGATLESRLSELPAYVRALQAAPSVVSIFAADQEGNYFLVRRMLEDQDLTVFAAPAGTALVVQSIERGKAGRSQRIYFDANQREISRADFPEGLNFDPRQRPWFEQAIQTPEVIQTDVYDFFTSHKRGMTVAQQVQGRQFVVGADIRLDTLNALLARLRMTPSARLLLQDEAQHILALDRTDDVVQQGFWQQALAQFAKAGAQVSMNTEQLQQVTFSGTRWLVGEMAIPLTVGRPLTLAVAIPEAEMLATAQAMRQQLIWLALGLLVLALPVAIWLGRRIAQPLSALVTDTQAIRRLDFEAPIETTSSILEVDELANTLRTTKTTLGHFIDLLRGISHENDFQRLMPALLQQTIAATQVHGGVLFMLADDGQSLRAMSGRWLGDAIPLDEHAALENGILSCDQALAQRQAVQSSVTPADQQRFGLPVVKAVSVPLFSREQRPIGVLVLLNEQPVDADRIRFTEALSGFAAMALETRELIALQKALFESFIQVMAGAIDAKSPYTGGHCARVPALAEMLAEATCASNEGTYAGFSMTPEDWEALHLAGWLHDCGKVTTPEYVVDKATKLESLYDRIHEVRMRFEVLKRDAEIACLRAVANGVPDAAAQAERDALLQALDAEFAFVAECNEGGEFMSPDRLTRLQAIASRTWLRTLDDTLGVSIEERKRKSQYPQPTLPVSEPLLSDKPDQQITHVAQVPFGPGNPWGFSMPVPALQFDRGELKNLSIGRGTLTDEERYKINEHITQTIVMLSALPYPRHLKNVPEIAGGHHERMDGKGYPRGLKGEQMSPLARMMAIADVFEALTASDRPYKPAKTLKQALGIMQKMASEGHLDVELFRVFLRQGVALRYAQQFLSPEQIDTEDWSAFEPA